MATIQCADCGGSVSERATACPHCGAPMQDTFIAGPRAQAIERTAKKWKGMGCAGALAVIAGFTIMCAGVQPPTAGGDPQFSALAGWGCLLITIGLIVALYARLAAWWHHG